MTNNPGAMAPQHDEETKHLCRIVLQTASAIAAFFLSVLTVVRCNFIKFTSVSGFDTPITVHFDPWRHETLSFYNHTNGDVYIVEHCTGYSDRNDIDAKWVTARAMTILPIILGFVGLNLFFLAACELYKVPKLQLVTSITYFFASLFQAISLIFISSNACKNNSFIAALSNTPISDIAFEETCSLSTGAKCIISATILWFLSAIMNAVAYNTKTPEDDVPETEPLINENDLKVDVWD